jgi:ribosomal protein S18 acetylase RimI-like enzyme
VEAPELPGLSHLLAPNVDHRKRIEAGDLLLVSEAGTQEPRGVVWANTSTHVDQYVGAVSRPSPSRWYLNQLFVAESARGRGVGLNLVRAVQSAAASTGCVEIIALVRPDNWASMKVFNRAGGHTVGSLWGLRFGSLGSVRWVRSMRSPAGTEEGTGTRAVG